MKTRFAAFLLACALLLTPALAAEEVRFPRTHPYTAFSDVTGHWSEPYVRTCVETGLMAGVGHGFAPDATLTKGEVAVLAARIHATLNGATLASGSTPWYQNGIDYLGKLGIAVTAPTAYTTRQEFFALLNAVLPEADLAPINSISLLPDSTDPAVLRFYNAGILTGMDAYGTFAGATPLTRADCAALCARIADPALRQHFSLKGQTPAGLFPGDTVVLTVAEQSVTYEEYETVLLSIIQETQEFYSEYGLIFSWSGNYGVENWSLFFKEAAKHSLAAQAITAAHAARLGCPVEALSLTLFGAPTEAEKAAYAAEHNLDRKAEGADEMISDLLLEQKLDGQVAQWIAEATITTTEAFDQIDPETLWEAQR